MAKPSQYFKQYQIADDKLMLAAGKPIPKKTDWRIQCAVEMVDPYTAIDQDHSCGPDASSASFSHFNLPPNSSIRA